MQGSSGGVGNDLLVDQGGSCRNVWSIVIHCAAYLCVMYFSICMLYLTVRKFLKKLSQSIL